MAGLVAAIYVFASGSPQDVNARHHRRAKRRRSSNDYRASEATPFFERLSGERSDAVLRTTIGRAKRRRSSNDYRASEATPFFERLSGERSDAVLRAAGALDGGGQKV